MRFLCVFVSVLAFATAKPTHEESHFDKEPVEESVKPHSVNMVGRCTMKDFTYSAVACQRVFFLSFRKDKKTPCGTRFRLFTKCYVNKFRKCYKNLVPVKELHRLMSEYRSAIEKSKKIQCGTAEFNISQFVRDLPETEGCPKDTMEKLDNCAKPWYHMFMKDKGDAKLCYRYQKYRACAKRVIALCNFNFPGMKWIFNKELNPFCDKKQLRSHMIY